jgi:hypothetical protein
VAFCEIAPEGRGHKSLDDVLIRAFPKASHPDGLRSRAIYPEPPGLRCSHVLGHGGVAVESPLDV